MKIKFVVLHILIISTAFLMAAIASYEKGLNKASSMYENLPHPNYDKKVEVEQEKEKITGIASWYDYDLCKKPDGSYVGRASGCLTNETIAQKSYWLKTNYCACRDFDRKTWIKVTNTNNGKSLTCYVLDFGPNPYIHPDRIVDLSPLAFSKIGNLRDGTIPVEIELADVKNDYDITP